MIRILKIAANIVGAIPVVLLIVYLLSTLYMGYKVRAKLEALKADGKPVSITDLSSRVPEKENAAVVYQQAFNLMTEQSIDKDMETIDEFFTGENPPKVNDVSRAVGRSEKIMQISEQALLRPHCRFPVDDDLLGVSTRHLGKLRTIARLFCVHAILSARSGRADQSVESLETAIKMANLLTDEPGLSPWLSRTSILKTVSFSISKVIATGNLNTDQADRLQRILTNRDQNQSYLVALDGERAIILSMFADYWNDEPRSNGFVRGLLVYPSQLGIIDATEQMKKVARYPYRIAVHNDLLPKEKCKLAFLYNMMVPMVSGTLEARDRSTAVTDAARIMLMLSCYRNQYGRFPDSLNQMADKLQWKLPKDPFSGRDFVYKPSSRGFMLYSIGEDLKDNGGRKRAGGKRTYQQQYDIVWKVD